MKLGLGSVSMFFDILFMIQHYILYPDHSEPIVERISLEKAILDDIESGDYVSTPNGNIPINAIKTP